MKERDKLAVGEKIVRAGDFITLPGGRIGRIQRVEGSLGVLVSGLDVGTLHTSGRLFFAGREHSQWEGTVLSSETE